MCSSTLLETSPAQPEIVDISLVEPHELEPLWEKERRLWLDKLHWDVSPVVDAIRRAVGRRSLAGKAVKLGRNVIGYGYYMLEGHRAVLASLTLAIAEAPGGTGPRILDAILLALKADPAVRRIESQFISFGVPWLAEVFVSHGFSVYQRGFLRRLVEPLPSEVVESSTVEFDLWRHSCVVEAARLMQKAHSGRVDSEINELYRTQEGCRTLLENVLDQRGCGRPIPSACLVARDRTRGLSGLVVSTEISPGHAHLAQVAVDPAWQGRGLGRASLIRALDALAKRGYRSVSLMVSGSNRRAYALYESMGFTEVVRFPVFSWDGAREAQSRSARSAPRDS